ncbi:MAG: M20/M25/M40 family metallo-hydrolase [Acidobacteriaceae bacterium]|nr:M20/M25/M40 family metallo-hydrolase [Acidobacteriaceae bacterium]
MRPFFCIALSASLLICPLFAEQDNSLEVVGKIKSEAFANSQVMDTLASLTDLYGPRLTGSPEFQQAADWAMGRLKEYGVSNVHAEPWGPFGRSWSLESYTLDMTAPRYSHLVAAPLAWSSPTNGTQTGEALFASIAVPANRYDISKRKEALHEYEEKWRGKLKGKIVLVADPKTPRPTTSPLFKRYTEAELAEMAQAPEPAIKRNVPLDQLEFPSDQEEAFKYMISLPASTMDELFDRFQELNDEQAKFFHDEGVIGIIRDDQRAHNGLVFGEAAGPHKGSTLAPPTFIVTEEQYSRMTRLAGHKQPVTLRMNLEAKVGDKDVNGLDIIGEIPGQSKPDEIVMIGAHFDSWHTGTGATDNGAGSAVMIEVMRILKTLNLKLDRTVRIGLWSGEEQGLLGSKAYVKAHFGDPKTMEVKHSEWDKFDAYLNLDNGSGKIRGVYLQGNDAARPLFQHMLEPYHDMGASTLTLKNTGGTDHLSFDAVGLPGFEFIQDPLDYGTVTHHSDMDTYSHAIQEDLMQASAIIATMAYDIANRPEQFPRKPMPANHEATPRP